jgi:hypothetical protein
MGVIELLDGSEALRCLVEKLDDETTYDIRGGGVIAVSAVGEQGGDLLC